MVKHERLGQISTFNFPAFARTKEEKRVLAKFQRLFLTAEERGSKGRPCEFVECDDKEAAAVCIRNEKVIVVLGDARRWSKDLGNAFNIINEMVEQDPEQYFIVQ